MHCRKSGAFEPDTCFMERYLLVAAKTGFSARHLPRSGKLARNLGDVDPLHLAVVTSVLAGSVLQAPAEYGDNARHSIVFQPPIFAMLLLALQLSRRSFRHCAHPTRP